MRELTKRTRILIGAGVAAIAAGAVYVYFNPGYCRSAKRAYGVEIRRCPDGDVRTVASITASALQRGGEGEVTVGLEGVYTTDRADSELSFRARKFSAELFLVDGETERKLEPVAREGRDRWERFGDSLSAIVSLPAVDDGDYTLRARVRSAAGETSVDLPLPLYAPARVHVLTDRPLYEPGNRVQFRALVLRAADLGPIDHRPGRWVVRDPAGQALLEEGIQGGDWGVVAGSFPLDAGAPTGTWTVSWETGADSGSASFDVEPFTLPRFRIEAASAGPFYGAGDVPVIDGAVTYSSGAPVSGAAVEIRWSAGGEWPPPPRWLEALPDRVTAGPSGSFRIVLPPVPGDLLGKATLSARLVATDPAGDRVGGAASILLSADPIAVSAITEMGDGLMRGANNRVYLRVTTADGRPLPGASIHVRRGWEPGDEGIKTELDADSVARVQLDPGPPVNVVIPAMPVRPALPDRGALVVRTGAHDLVAGADASLADRAVMDRWIDPLGACARWVESGAAEARVALRVSPAGAITAAVPGKDDLSRCAAQVIAKTRLPAAAARLYSVSFRFNDPDLPRLETAISSSFNSVPEVEALVAAAALDGRGCIPEGLDGELGEALAWQIRAGERTLSAQWIRTARSNPVPASMRACVLAALARRQLDEPAGASDLGLIKLVVSRPGAPVAAAPQPTIMKGYELRVSVADRGETILRMRPSEIPNLRLRASPILPRPGDTVEVTFLRGPEFRGELPETLSVQHLTRTFTVDVDRKKKTASVALPADASGWFELRAAGALTRVFVRPASELTVAVSPEQPRYRPGDRAVINIQTTAGNSGTRAAVGLFGVDSSLAQLRPLPGAGALESMRPPVEMSEPAFGVLEAQALALGRIRGESAAEATVLKVSRVPEPAEVDALVSGSARGQLDPIAELTDRFYPVLTELHAQVRTWEGSAPRSEVMTPKRMAELWNRALDAVAARGGSVVDAFGRRMRLHRLPDDLLALTEPRQVVVSGTRLPEDFENWSEWVARSKP